MFHGFCRILQGNESLWTFLWNVEEFRTFSVAIRIPQAADEDFPGAQAVGSVRERGVGLAGQLLGFHHLDRGKTGKIPGKMGKTGIIPQLPPPGMGRILGKMGKVLGNQVAGGKWGFAGKGLLECLKGKGRIKGEK